MICCLNPDCSNPQNPNNHKICQTCHTPLVPLLRNRFRVLRVLSDEGGFGRTYISEDIDKLNELCVVKQLVIYLTSLYYYISIIFLAYINDTCIASYRTHKYPNQ